MERRGEREGGVGRRKGRVGKDQGGVGREERSREEGSPWREGGGRGGN